MAKLLLIHLNKEYRENMHERLFKLWYYTISHKQMLLRSIGVDGECNIDIYFGDVLYIEIPTQINKIKIVETSQEDIEYITEKIGCTDKIVTVLMSDCHKYYIVSSIIKVSENKLGMFELPFDIPDYIRGIEDTK